jgi:glycolate oxidase
MIDAKIIDSLTRIVGKNNIGTSPEDLMAYSYDAFTLEAHRPDAVVFPTDASRVAAVLKIANENKIPVTPRGGGTNVSGGSIPIKGGIVLCTTIKGGIVLCTTRMNRIIEINKANLHAIIEPGVVLLDFQEALAKQGLFFPPDPQSAQGCTLGGVIAENSGGPSCLKYGVAKLYVLGLEVALADGRIVKLGGLTPKNRTGYELMMLFAGSEGTLGIITRINVRLLPAPAASKTIVATFSDIEVAGGTVTDIIAGGVLPAKVEFIDPYTFEKFYALLPAKVLDESKALLLIQVDGLPETVEAEAKHVYALCKKTASDVRLAADKAEAAKFWAARSAQFSVISSRAHTVITEDVSVPRDKIVEFINRGTAAAKKYDVPLSFAGHLGDGNFHPAVMTDNREKEPFARAEKLMDEIIEIALSVGGVISGEHGIGLEKSRFLKKAMDPNAIIIMKQIKDVLDPNRILNPGKIWEEEN